ncbi:hypothetical protein GV64_15810 [Endozoicomonas elysicola]|uniref:Uncharacterized protein n=1 Tax=Endozoicomonas elysicola TaxID=305900 RepID=A0A081KCX1_9GAMM|nr:hypothetical protein GV64_15810 [Endozoicomonas elysicola]
MLIFYTNVFVLDQKLNFCIFNKEQLIFFNSADMKKISILISLVSLLACFIWYVREPGFEPFLTGITILNGFIVFLFTLNNLESTKFESNETDSLNIVYSDNFEINKLFSLKLKSDFFRVINYFSKKISPYLYVLICFVFIKRYEMVGNIAYLVSLPLIGITLYLAYAYSTAWLKHHTEM